MPLILDPKSYKDWLHVKNELSITEVLNTFTKQELVSYPVSKSIFSNKIDSNIPNILDKVEFQRGLF